MTVVPRFVLASVSGARLRTLRAAGVDPVVAVSGVDESGVTGPAAEVVQTLAIRKATAVADRFETALVLGCDSVLELDGEALGKPRDAREAVRRWHRMRGRSGVLHTGHCLVDTGTGRRLAQVASTAVHFADITDDEIEAYVATGEPLAVAGAFTLEGLGGAFIERVEGDPSNVVGLSLPLLRRLVTDLGHHWPDLWRTGS